MCVVPRIVRSYLADGRHGGAGGVWLHLKHRSIDKFVQLEHPVVSHIIELVHHSAQRSGMFSNVLQRGFASLLSIWSSCCQTNSVNLSPPLEKFIHGVPSLVPFGVFNVCDQSSTHEPKMVEWCEFYSVTWEQEPALVKLDCVISWKPNAPAAKSAVNWLVHWFTFWIFPCGQKILKKKAASHK